MKLQLPSITAGFVLLVAGSASAADEPRISFKRHIEPILSTNCLECHSQEKAGKKPKGGLALDTTAGILAGGVIEVGKPDESTLYDRLILDPDDEDIMPPKKTGDPLSKEDAELVRLWILQGATFGDGGTARKPNEPVKELTIDQVRAMGIKAPNPDAVRRLTTLGATIVPVSVETPQLLSVEFISTYSKIGDEQIKELYAIAPNIVELNLAKTKITDEGMKVVGALARLNRLNLNNTQISDSSLANLASLTELEWLNLYGTSISDDALPHLAKLRKLKSIYVWNSKITDEGIAKLGSTLGSAKIVDEVVSEKNRFDVDDL